MRPKNISFLISAMLLLLLGSFALSAMAQHGEMVRIGKKGVIPFDSPVRVGDVLLKPGHYQIQHVVEGQDHVIIFNKMISSGRGYTPAASEKVAARVKCRVEPLGEKAKHGGVRFGTNAAGEKAVEEVHIQGENVKHVF